MTIIHLKKFQEEAIRQLRKQFLELWKTTNRKLPLILKSPTGSGKTVMIAQFLKDMSNDPQFNVDKSYLWFSFNEESYVQSKNKLFDYYGGANELNLLDLNDLSNGKLEKNNVFFINWQKIKSSTKEGRKLRNPTEYTYGDEGIFDEFIKRTQGDNRELVLIVDEAHRDTDTVLADELIDLINPRIILKITATPKTEPSASDVLQKRAGFVEVIREDVVEEGLIKEKVITQTKEDLDKLAKKEIDQDSMLLELAFNKRSELQKEYKDLGLEINPLVLVQLPNDDQARKETLDKSKLDIVKDFLRDKDIDEKDIAIWLSNKKENLEEIEQNDSLVSFLIFKQAAATGWDCPRASVLVMFREIKSPVFHTQTVGRILRMPEAIHYPKPNLNIGYLYTNYERNQIHLPDNQIGKNKPANLPSFRKDGIKPIILQSTFMGRTDYNDLGDSFQITFKDVADKFFDVEKKEFIENVKKKLIAKGLDLYQVKVKNKLIVDAEIEDYDNFVKEIKERGDDLSEETSKHDIERMYNLLCFNIISKQEEENKKFAPERSWGKLKTALNVWFAEKIQERRSAYYTIIVNDFLKSDSILKKLIAEVLEQYRPIRQEEVKKKESRARRIEDLEIPRPSLFFTEDYEEIEGLNKNSMTPFYIGKDYSGKKNETEFIKYIESKNVDWWYKSGDSGSEHFSIPFYDEVERKEKLFYPDWVIKIKDTILIFDTKQGLSGTVGSADTKRKAEALQKWIKEQNKAGKKFKGGIISNVSGIWKINDNDEYNADVNYTEWQDLEI
ncbi:type III restriction enzyme, res subunit [archaeon BMS3Abin17]|nr:type III restriction enzyme, res subunit [archaeon BMS3Abin17]HDZ60725.1 restriction endonuclease subunit R [Candidatus Pacearchaeota archaeon]